MVNSLFGETWRIAEFGPTNCQLDSETSQIIDQVLDAAKIIYDYEYEDRNGALDEEE